MIGSSIRLYVSCPLQPCAGWVGWCFHNLTRVPQLQVLCGKFSIWTLGPFNCATVDILQVKAISPCPLKIWVLDLGAKGRPESLLWRLSSQSFMVSDAPGSNISTVAWLCSYHYTFMLSITRSFSCHLLGQIQILGEVSMTLKLDCSLNCLDILSHHVLYKHRRWSSFFPLTLHPSPPSSQDTLLSWIHPNSLFIKVSPNAPVPQNFQHVHSENCLTVRD